MADENTINTGKYIIREDDVVFTEDIVDAMSDRYLHTCLHFVVLSGNVTFSVGTKTFNAQVNDCVIIPNRPEVSQIHPSSDFRMTAVIVSREFMQVSLPKSSYETAGLTAMAQNPVMPLTDAEAAQILDDFRQVQHRFHQVSHAYYADMVSRSVEMMVLDMYHIHALQYSDDLKGVDQSAWIMRRFIDLLQQGLIRQHRTVEYYASRLNITPNYLTECCIKTSRHNASFFIEHFTAEEIARLLKREDLSITDVAYQLDFNTTNYFTRYVKRVLGMTPSQYKAKFSVKK